MYKDVDLEALNNYLDEDNFLYSSAKVVPGLVREIPVIDVNYWKQQMISD